MDKVKGEKSFDNTKKKLKANLASVGEWFKQAAWLQVVLIVGVIFALLLSIPSIVKCSQDLSEDSKFFKDSTIPFSRLLDEDGKYAKGNSGLVGNANLNGTESYSEDLEGFVVLFYNIDDETFMGEQQKYFEDGLKFLQKNNEKIGKNIKFFSVDVSWNPNWKSGDTNDYSSTGNYVNETKNSSSKSQRISLQQQKDYLKDAILPTYIAQINGSGKYGVNDKYISEEVKVSDLQNSDFTSDYAGNNASVSYHTIPTCFVTYIKQKGENKYDINKPDKVRFKQSLSLSSESDAAKEIMDLFNFKINSSQNIN